MKKQEEVITTNLADFGYREWEEVQKLVNAKMENGFPDDFYNEEVTIMFNRNSGSVFFTNSEYQVCMAGDNKLYSFYTCSNCGHEGFGDEGFEDSKDKSLCNECYISENK